MEPDLLQPEPRRWLSASVLAAIEGEYVFYLRASKYHSNTVRVYLACVAHFAKWVTEEGLGLVQIDETVQRPASVSRHQSANLRMPSAGSQIAPRSAGRRS